MFPWLRQLQGRELFALRGNSRALRNLIPSVSRTRKGRQLNRVVLRRRERETSLSKLFSSNTRPLPGEYRTRVAP
ncbi:hypothetical protein RRG08_040195 [Elysia crispata]|uniref:Uncharacterized protein n=1 Tax=Elysia crispata TaxID=231223 RepID=A0AAE0XX39_9GAST|nr:hypothetical protein RRG08_040195 [Elysia crispata]